MKRALHSKWSKAIFILQQLTLKSFEGVFNFTNWCWGVLMLMLPVATIHHILKGQVITIIASLSKSFNTISINCKKCAVKASYWWWNGDSKQWQRCGKLGKIAINCRLGSKRTETHSACLLWVCVCRWGGRLTTSAGRWSGHCTPSWRHRSWQSFVWRDSPLSKWHHLKLSLYYLCFVSLIKMLQYIWNIALLNFLFWVINNKNCGPNIEKE